MKSNIQNNYFNLNQIKDKIKNKLNDQSKEINELITLLNINENKNIINEIKENENNIFKNFKIENMKHIITLNDNKGSIWCLKTLEDGRLAAGDEYSNLIIYNKETFKPEIIIKNNYIVLGILLN